MSEYLFNLNISDERWIKNAVKAFRCGVGSIGWRLFFLAKGNGNTVKVTRLASLLKRSILRTLTKIKPRRFAALTLVWKDLNWDWSCYNFFPSHFLCPLNTSNVGWLQKSNTYGCTTFRISEPVMFGESRRITTSHTLETSDRANHNIAFYAFLQRWPLISFSFWVFRQSLATLFVRFPVKKVGLLEYASNRHPDI